MNIDWINTTKPVVEYADWAEEDADVLTARFEAEFGVANGENIGGIIVYSDNCVYDYENSVGWVR